ncbi:hypothetical protein KUU24_31320, partial [Pseudomonas aeruginosa]|nr:hypothetical protein [Pseudomonas aeruginosa]
CYSPPRSLTEQFCQRHGEDATFSTESAGCCLMQQAENGQKQTFKHYLELSRGTFLKLKGPRMWTFSLLLITC